MNNQIKLLKNLIQEDSNIINLYVYGSHVYGTVNPQSDYDFICIVQDKSILENKEYTDKLEKFGDFNYFSVDEFSTMIKAHEITALECLFLQPELIIKESQPFSFELNLPQLRHAISSKSSNSWVKCKKKFIIPEDYNAYIGQKSAFHSLRILDFGTQIAKHQKIIDYSAANSYFFEILKLDNWDDINAKFKGIYNNLSTQFKLLAPKEINMVEDNLISKKISLKP